MTYPSIIATYTDPLATQKLGGPSHSAIEQAQNANLTAVETFLGVEGASSTAGTLIYDVRSPGSSGGGHVQGAAYGGTGQTNYAKGNVLVATSASVLTKLTVGTDNQVLTANSGASGGVSWNSFPGTPTVRIFSVASGSPTTSSVLATWNKPSVLSYIIVEVQGGGGAGGGVSGANFSAGGGGGGYARKVITASSILGNNASVITGGGGATNSAATGSVGGTSAFNYIGNAASISAIGGSGGTGGSSSSNQGVNGGVAIGGDINITGGASGRSGSNNTGLTYGGFGGSAILGQSTQGGEGTQAGTNGLSYGGGGGGAANHNTGGQGAPGVVIIYEY